MATKTSQHRAAAIYARTLLELGSEKGMQSAIKSDVESLRAVFVRLPEYGKALGHPALSAEKKSTLAAPLSANASDLMQRFLKLLVFKGRLALLEAICDEYLRLEEEARSVKRARVISASPLSAAQLEQLSKGLVARHPGRTYVLHNDVDPSLIAGFRVEEDDFIIDASIRHKLNTLRHQLTA